MKDVTQAIVHMCSNIYLDYRAIQTSKCGTNVLDILH